MISFLELIHSKDLIGFRIDPPEMHRRFRISLLKCNIRFRISPPEMHRRGVLIYPVYYERKALKNLF